MTSLTLEKLNMGHFKAWIEITENDHLTKSEYEQMLSHIEQNEKQRRNYCFMVSEAQNYIGIISIFNIILGEFQSGMLDYMIHPLLRRKGYADQSIKLIEDFAFNLLDLKKLTAHVEVDNMASQKLLIKNKYSYRFEDHAFFRDNTSRPGHIFTKVKPTITQEV